MSLAESPEITVPDAPLRPVGLFPRTLRRRWLQILSQWGILSTALVFAANSITEPHYEATAWLKVGPRALEIGRTAELNPRDLETYRYMITSPDVLRIALRDS